MNVIFINASPEGFFFSENSTANENEWAAS